jgi:DNA-binding transcriptional LysR family regulator
MDDTYSLDLFNLDPVVWQLDWNLLRTFIVIVQERSITRAASRLLLSQPAVSAALKRLEDRLDTRLIERGGSNFHVTDEGNVLFRQCLELYGQVSQLPAMIAAAQGRVRGRIAVVLASNTGTGIFDTVLADFHRDNPEVTFALTIASSAQAVQAVAAKVATAAICYAPRKQAGLDYQHLARMPFGLYCGRGHPFHGRADLVVDDLKGSDFVSFQPARLGDDMWFDDMVRLRRRIEANVVGHSFNMREVYRMVMAGLGIALFPVPAVDDYVARGDLWPLPGDGDPPAADIYVVTNARTGHSLPERLFLDALKRGIDGTPQGKRHLDWDKSPGFPPD